jgi:transposase-like protein
MQCPECNSTHIRKNGVKKGKQNYLCVDCVRQCWVLGDHSRHLARKLHEVTRKR